MPRKSLTEDGTLGKVTEAKSDGSYLIQVITPGWGSSGYYSPQVLEAAGKAKVWPAGTHMYFDHPTATEDAERPSRSVKDLAAVLVEDATWNGSALVAKAKPIGLGKSVLEDKTFREAVGVSVRASAEGDVGEAAGRRGWIVKEIFADTFNSVDVVTHAGRGGMILESARKAAQEAGELDSDRRDKFRDAVRDAHASEGVDVWVEDYDDTTVYWDRWGGDDPGTFSQEYTETDDAVELTGDPVKVRVKRTYVPVDEAEVPPRTVELTREAAVKAIRESRNVGQWMESRIHLAFTVTADEMFGDGRLTREERIALSKGIGAALDAFTASVEASAPQLYGRDLWADPAALAEAATAVPVHPAGSNPIKEHTMPDIEESRLRELEEAHGRVPALEAERDAATARAEKAERDLKLSEARDYARDFGSKRVKAANSELAAPIVDKIVNEAMRDITLGDDDRLDTEAFGARVDEVRKNEETYLASIAENVGSVRGLGEAKNKSTVTEAQAGSTIAGVFGVNTPKAG